MAAALVGALMVLPLAAYAPRGARLLEGSKLAPYVSTVADLVNVTAPSDLAARYRSGIEKVRKLWRGEAEPPSGPAAKPPAAAPKPAGKR